MDLKEKTPANTTDPVTEIREAVEQIAKARKRPALAMVTPHMRRAKLMDYCDAVAALPTDAPVDVMLSSHGGCIDTAYVIARALGRRPVPTAVFVPLCAKSAATMVALVADELVLGPLGELGPIDAQFDRKRQADFASRCSELAFLKALEQAGEAAVDLFDESMSRILSRSGMTPYDGATKAADLVGELMGRVYSQVDPIRLAEATRALEVAAEFGERLLRRYRPDLPADRLRNLLAKLVYGYPCHGFPLDLEELAELALPARAAEGVEVNALDRMARVLLLLEDEIELIEVIEPATVEKVRPESANRKTSDQASVLAATA